MTTLPLRFLAALTLLGLIASCGDETMEEKINRRLSEAVQEATGAAADIDLDSLGEELNRAVSDLELDSIKLGSLSDVEVIGFRELKPLMPETIAGLARTKHIGETQKMLGIKFSQAEATYGEGDRRVEAKLIDSGGAGVLLRMFAGITGLEVDKETEDGSERTLELDGHKAYEKSSARNGITTSSLSVLVHGRFVVQLEGRGVTAEQLTAGFRDFDTGALPETVEGEEAQ